VKEQVVKLVDNLKNPYFNIFHWSKGEHFDIDAITRALALKDNIMASISKNDKKKKSTQASLDNLQ
jgi:hypothetical protein